MWPGTCPGPVGTVREDPHGHAHTRGVSANFTSGSVWTGDNLPILRGRNSACVDLICLDPPFNSNRTYEPPIGPKAAGASFKDAWTLDDADVHEHGDPVVVSI